MDVFGASRETFLARVGRRLRYVSGASSTERWLTRRHGLGYAFGRSAAHKIWRIGMTRIYARTLDTT